MPFDVSRRTLEHLDWLDLLARWCDRATTPRGRARLAPPEARDDDAHLAPFARDASEARRRQRETTEARALLERDPPPFGGVADVDPMLRRAAMGGVLSGREILDVRGVLQALHATSRWLERHAESAPELAALAPSFADLHDLEQDVARCLDTEGEVRDAASPVLAAARREASALAGELQRRLSTYLSDPDIAPALSDRFVTVRNDRFVLPVRSDSRGRVRGIVHDASGSGTTLFVEPEAVVELNNRLKQAGLTVQQETQRVLRDLSVRVGHATPEIDAGLEALADLDVALARAALARESQATAPEMGDASVLFGPQLRHPLLPADRVVANDIALGRSFSVLVLSGPNAGGKTVALKCAGLAVLCARAGLHVAADSGARVDAFDAVLADIGDEQSLRESLSTFSAHMANVARIVERAGARSLVLLDELGDGTDPGEGASLAQAVLESLADAGARVVVTTHFGLLKEMAAVDPRFANASFDFDPITLAPTYRMRIGVAGASSATSVAARMGLRSDVIARATALLEREDRRLERMLAELGASRAALEREQYEATRVRAESEAARAEYRAKLQRLQEQRDRLFAKMRGELEAAFRDAHGEVRAVIRDLQRGTSARDAAHARERLLALEARADAVALEIAPAPAPPALRVDWSRACAGDRVQLPGGETGEVLTLPDRHGRVSVRVGTARLQVPADRLSMTTPGDTGRSVVREPPRVSIERTSDDAVGGDSGACDLRGLRVEEAIDRLVGALDRAALAGRTRLRVVHGLGGGALRDAVRTHLAASPYVGSFAGAEPTDGGDGATLVTLRDG